MLVACTFEKLAAMKDKFRNLLEDKLLIVEGNVSEYRTLASSLYGRSLSNLISRGSIY